ncbi:MAG: cation:proton antiporter [Dehalococcoidia bacterium]|jgi:Kef-type K+ transport system membrane component KefB
MEELEIIQGVLISIVAAAVMGYIMHRLRQPVIMGYIIAGIVIGPELGLKWVTHPDAINFTSELGLIALMFMVGLELDLRQIKKSGKSLIFLAVLQFAVCVALGLAFFNLPGFSGGGEYAALYLAIVFALSSTMIVVKLLYDKFELDTLPGRLTLGILVLQDIWAIIFLTIQPNLDNPAIGTLGLALLKGVGLIVGCVLVSRFILPRVFKGIAKNPELVLVTALGWCFLISWLAGDVAGLSRAMGALIAGVSLATFPYKQEINDRVNSIRSFFLILFFVSLGMRVAQPSLHIFLVSLAASLFLIVSRFISLSPALYLMKKGIRVSFLVPLNIAQISEFALVIVAIGISYGHVNQDVMTIVLFTVMITFLVSTYMIMYSHKLYLVADRVLKVFKLSDAGMKAEEAVEVEAHRPILFLGFYRIASHLLQAVEKQNPAITEKIEVIDFNPEVHQKLNRHGVKCVFGDLGNTGTLTECGLEEAKVVVSTIPDTILKGTSNMALLKYTKKVNPKARVIVTAESLELAKKLWAAGADFVILPHFEAAEKTATLLEKLLTEESIPDACSEYRCKVMEDEGEIIG